MSLPIFQDTGITLQTLLAFLGNRNVSGRYNNWQTFRRRQTYDAHDVQQAFTSNLAH